MKRIQPVDNPALNPCTSSSPLPSAHPDMFSEHPDPSGYTSDPFYSPPPSDALSNLSGLSDDTAHASLTDKGKAREHPPTLPPLSFSPSGLAYTIDDWSSSLPGPSSYRSSLNTPSSSHSPSSSIESTVVRADDAHKLPCRTRSLSNLSIHSTTPSMSKIRIKLATSSKTPVNLARKLLSRNKADVSGPSVSNDLADPLSDDLLLSETGNCLFPWQTRDITRASSPRPGVEIHEAPLTILDTTAVWSPASDSHSVDAVLPRGKSRSYSYPFPKSACDVVPDLESNVIPSPLYARDLFDEILPRELRLRVFSALISLHVADHERLQSSAKWSVLAASSSKNRWVGRNRGIRELVKLSRVSKSWRALVFDGQLWQSVDLQAFPAATNGFLTCLVQLSGPFVNDLDLSGHTHLSPTGLVDMAGGLCVRSAPILNFTYTQLTTITLQGCTSLTTQSLHSLLIRSPFLRSLNVKGLQAVTNATFDVLALCSHLTSLNMNRCANIDGDGVCAFGAAVMARGAHLALKELRLCGLQMISDDTLARLGRAAPHLEVLDLSYCGSLHNSALEAFVSCSEDEIGVGESILLTAREAGRDSRDWRRYRRRMTRLRHLSLSNCTMLTDIACSNLAYSVPRLELLELAGIGPTLRDDGLVHLLGTTPFIRKLDLEDASEITDAVLDVLAPEVEDIESDKTEYPKPGHALEHLTVSHATNLTNDAFKSLIHRCPKLRILEADSTSISGAVLKEFVRQVSQRGMSDAGLVVVDCRSVGERSVKDVVANTRPRKGWRSWEARKLGYLDARDGEDLKVGQDECEEKRVVIKSFYGWQTVDAVRHMRERKKKANRKAQSAPTSEPEEGDRLTGKLRWWGLNSRTTSGSNTPGEDGNREGCVVM